MTVKLLSRDLVRTVDSIGLPSAPHPVEGWAARQDAYTIHVTTSLRDTAERVIELVGGAKVAILTDLLDWLTGTQIGRRDVIVNLGGGIVIDMGGWALTFPQPRMPMRTHGRVVWLPAAGKPHRCPAGLEWRRCARSS